MRHLIVSREYPPASYPPGGIGTYVANIAQLLAERGETVHVIAERWAGAKEVEETLCDGRLVVHRIGQDDLPDHGTASARSRLRRELDGLKASEFPCQWFAWHSAFLAERLSAEEGIDVIEAQEWEAPLYYLLLRRANGLAEGPAPPCIVHLHSATAFIRRYNGALAASGTELLMERLEEYCVRAADALLCPSRYYAAQCIDHFGLADGSIEVIPLPVGTKPAPERDPQIWSTGSICFVGRIEPRKGVVEWVEAAARVAAEQPDLHFDFVGADQVGLQRALETSIASELRSRFRFHGSQPREALPRYLAGARAAVVPSRWENFPNVCIEAMSSGVPVIATRLGGMVEMIEDGETGWLANGEGVASIEEGLTEALRRCVATPAAKLAEMGAAARDAVDRICNNDDVVDAHVALRGRVAGLGAVTSRHGYSPRFSTFASRSRRQGDLQPAGAGLVVHVESTASAAPLVASIRRQTVPPAAVVLVETRLAGPPSDVLQNGGTETVVGAPGAGPARAWNVGFDALSDERVGYWIFLDDRDVLEPCLLERIESIFRHRSDVGVVAPWTSRTAGLPALIAPPCADLMHQLIDNDLTPGSAYRAEVFGEQVPFPVNGQGPTARWALANAVLGRGWTATVLPEQLVFRSEPPTSIGWPKSTALRAIRAEVLAGLAGSFSPGTLEIVQEYVPFPNADRSGPPRRGGRLPRYASAIAHPSMAARAVRKWMRRHA